tara:strand:+ start:359 stop:496 length:138 start_codon:yes stop_codon:yes gene_type:complete
MIDKMDLKSYKKSIKKTEKTEKQIDATISENLNSLVELKSLEKEP